MTFKVFVRNWWQENPSYPNGLEPDPGARKYTIAKGIESEEKAFEIAKEYNKKHKPGRLSRMAEVDEEKPKKRSHR